MKREADRGGAGQDLRIRERNQALILDAAMAIFAKKGFEGTSIAEIAEHCGLPKANVYYYFKTKQAIYRTLIADLIQEWDKALAHLTIEREPAAAIGDYIRAKLAFSRKYQAQSKLFANEAVHGGRFLTKSDHAHMQAATRQKAKVFEAWMAAGKMDPVDPMHLFIMLWAATQFYADFEVLAVDALNTKRIRANDYAIAEATITRIILKGCGVI